MLGTVSTVAQELNAALAEVELLNPLTVVIPVGGTSYACSVGTGLAGSKLGEGGFGSVSDVRIVIRFAVLDTPPTLHSKLSLNSKTFRVDEIVNDPTNTYFVLTCVDPTRGV